MADDDASWARFLLTDPRDVGCDEAWRLIHVYAEQVAVGSDPERDFPGIAAHLAACGPCADDFQGLLLTLRASFGPPATGLTDS
jgi:hypothetical protein